MEPKVIQAWCYECVKSQYQYTMTSSELDILWSCIVSALLVGGFISSLVAPNISNRYGCKGAVVIHNVMSVFASILFVTSRYASSVEMILVARLIAGLAAGLAVCIVPMYLTELGHVTQRGTLGCLFTVGVTGGMVVGQVAGFDVLLGTEASWHYLLAASGVAVFVFSTALPFLPESPKYLYVIKNDRDESIRELTRLRGLPAESLTEELELMKENRRIEAEEGGKHSLLSLARSPEFRLPLILVISLQAVKMLSGALAIDFYSERIYQSIGFSKVVIEYATLMAGFLAFFTMIDTTLLTPRLNRRTLFFCSLFTMALLECLLAPTLFYAQATAWTPYLCIVNMVLVAAAYNAGLSATPAFIPNELFIVGPSSVAMAYSGIIYWLIYIVLSMVFPLVQASLGDLILLPNAVCITAIGTFLWFYLPETKDRNPADIAEMLKHGFRSKIEKSTKKPEGRTCLADDSLFSNKKASEDISVVLKSMRRF